MTTAVYRITGMAGAGSAHTVALRSDGALWACGLNSNGQLGDNTTIFRPGPVNVLSGVAAVAAGNAHTVALKNDGSVWAWGLNTNGQLGDGTTTQRIAPVKITSLSGVVAVAANGSQSAALKSDGTVWTWGLNTNGQLGDNTTTQRTAPVRVGALTGVTAIAVGTSHMAALKNDGTLWAWGLNTSGQLGDTTLVQRTAPVQVSGFTGATAVAAGGAHTLALKNDGTVWAWGLNSSGQLGDNTTTQRTTPVRINGLTGVGAVAAGSAHSAALRNDGTTAFWGANTSGQLGDGTATALRFPWTLPGVTNAVAVVAGANHTAVLRADGTLTTFGANTSGQLGDGTSSQRNMAVQGAALNGVAAVSAGGVHTAAVRGDGTLRAWGGNTNGQIGDNTAVLRSAPVTPAGLAGIASVSAGNLHTVALRTDGTLRAWGFNGNGQLGDNTVTQRAVPVTVPGLTGVVEVSAGHRHTAAVKADGSIWAWGLNTNGQIGDGSLVQRNAPVQVPGLTGMASVSAGVAHTLALKNDGSVWAWGLNTNGQLGNGATTQSAAPVQVTGLTGAMAVSAGATHSVALKNDGTVWAWGLNSNGQLGNGTTTQSTAPVQVPGLTGVVAVSANAAYTLALKSDGTVWAWGLNSSGQLGDGTGTQRNAPVRVTGLTGVVAVSAGNLHAVALLADGTLRTWGQAGSGQFWLGPVLKKTALRLVPDASDLNQNAVADAWEQAQFGNTTTAVTLDPDLDGLSHIQEAELGSNPASANADADLFSDLVDPAPQVAGTEPVPVFTQGPGNNQSGLPGTFLAQPLETVVTLAGQPMANTPVIVRLTAGAAKIALRPEAAATTGHALLARTDAQGRARVFVQLAATGTAPSAVTFAGLPQPIVFQATTITAPTAPTEVNAAPGNARVTLNWPAVAGATSYKVQRSITSGTGYADFDGNTTTNPTFTDTGLTNGTAYYYVVFALNAGGSSLTSAQATATPVAPPIAPTGVTAVPGNAEVTLTWNAVSGATGYVVRRSTTSGGGYAAFPGNTTADTSLVNTGLTNGTPYFYVVVATNAGGVGPDSAQAAATPVTPLLPPPNPVRAVALTGGVALHWDAVPGATAYKIRRSVAGNDEEFTSTVPSHMDQPLVNETTYSYTVRSVNEFGPGPDSAPVTVTPRVVLVFQDTNTDGVDDAWAVQHFGSVNFATAGDADNDGLSNLAEYQSESDPNNSDSDGDGIPDGEDPVPSVAQPAQPYLTVVVPDQERLARKEIEEKDFDYTRIRLEWGQWGSPSHTTQFLIEQRISAGEWTPFATHGPAVREMNVSGLLAEQNYYFRITAVNTLNGRSATSSPSTAAYQLPLFRAMSVSLSELTRSKPGFKEFAVDSAPPLAVPKYYLVQTEQFNSESRSVWLEDDGPYTRAEISTSNWVQTHIPGDYVVRAQGSWDWSANWTGWGNVFGERYFYSGTASRGETGSLLLQERSKYNLTKRAEATWSSSWSDFSAQSGVSFSTEESEEKSYQLNEAFRVDPEKQRWLGSEFDLKQGHLEYTGRSQRDWDFSQRFPDSSNSSTIAANTEADVAGRWTGMSVYDEEGEIYGEKYSYSSQTVLSNPAWNPFGGFWNKMPWFQGFSSNPTKDVSPTRSYLHLEYDYGSSGSSSASLLTQLSEEFTTDDFTALVAREMPDWREPVYNFYGWGRYAWGNWGWDSYHTYQSSPYGWWLAQPQLSKTEESYRLRKSRFQLQTNPSLGVRVKWHLVFIPENDPETEEDESEESKVVDSDTWQSPPAGGSSPLKMVDPSEWTHGNGNYYLAVPLRLMGYDDSHGAGSVLLDRNEKISVGTTMYETTRSTGDAQADGQTSTVFESSFWVATFHWPGTTYKFTWQDAGITVRCSYHDADGKWVERVLRSGDTLTVEELATCSGFQVQADPTQIQRLDFLIQLAATSRDGKSLGDDAIKTKILLPVELVDTKDGILDDKAPTGTTITDANRDVSVVPKKAVDDKNPKSIAWIEPHGVTNGLDPEMPWLVLRVRGAEAMGLKIRWKIQVRYTRPNGRVIDEDTVKIPPADYSPSDWVTEDLDGAVEIYANNLWITAVWHGFFGGDAELTYQILSGGGAAIGAEEKISFYVRGKNPDNIKARDYLSSSQPDLWFAYAICKHETKEYRYGGTFYNQFVGNPSGKTLKYTSYNRTFDLAYGKPTWNWDFSDSKPGGFGLFQVTGWQGKGNGNIPRGVIWNWQRNMDEGAQEIRRDKVPAATNYFNAVKSKYGQSTPAPPDVATGRSRSLSGWEVSVIVRYNGLGGTDSHPELRQWLGKYSQDPWTYSGGNWYGPKPNSENYLNKVIPEIE